MTSTVLKPLAWASMEEAAQPRMGIALAQPVQIDARLDLDLARGDLPGLAAVEVGERRGCCFCGSWKLPDVRLRRRTRLAARASPTPAAGVARAWRSEDRRRRHLAAGTRGFAFTGSRLRVA